MREEDSAIGAHIRLGVGASHECRIDAGLWRRGGVMQRHAKQKPLVHLSLYCRLYQRD